MTRALALAALFALAPPALAQWAWDAELQASAERADNPFRVPDVLLAEEAVRDSALVDDTVLPLRATAEVGRAWGATALQLRYRTTFQHHRGAGDLDGATHAVRLRAETARGPLEARLDGHWRRVERVGINVLGDAPPQLFRYRQPELAGRLRWTPSNAHRVTLQAAVTRRDYEVQLGSLPLDHRQAEVEAAWRARRRVPGRTLWQVQATAGLRDRAYGGLRARDTDGGRADGHPLNRLRYLDAAVEGEVSLAPRLALDAELGARRRTDPFEGYYTYDSWAARGGVTWEPTDRVTVGAGAAFRRIGYAVQRAPQETGADPRLVYHYLTWQAEAAVRPAAGLEVAAFVDGTRRRSNVTREPLVRRRSYLTSVVGLAVRLDLRRAAAGAD